MTWGLFRGGYTPEPQPRGSPLTAVCPRTKKGPGSLTQAQAKSVFALAAWLAGPFPSRPCWHLLHPSLKLPPDPPIPLTPERNEPHETEKFLEVDCSLRVWA